MSLRSTVLYALQIGSRRWLSALLAGTVTSFVLMPTASHADPVPVSETPLNGWDVNGTVYAVEILGDTVYVGGQFTTALPTSGTSQPRANLAAFSLSTGALLSFRADTNQVVRAIEATGTTVYVGGQFTTIAGTARNRLAAVNATSGAIVTTFNPNASGLVYALDSSAGVVYAGGAFTSMGGNSSVPRLAAVNGTTGAVIPAFDPNPDNTVRSVVVAGTRVYAGGQFTGIAGTSRRNVAGVSTVDGSVSGGDFSSTATGRGLALDVSPDGASLYGALGDGGNRVVAWNTTSGSQRWRQKAMGDVQAVSYESGNVYWGFHEGFEDDLTLRLLASDADTGALENFSPTINTFYGVWAIDSSATAVVAGGTFTTVQGIATRGLAIFR